MEETMESYRLKIKDIADVKVEVARLKDEGQRVVFTNGCFDILHSGHARYLFAARQLGDHLIVAVNSDRSVKAIKGRARPIVPQEDRAELVAALGCVDTVLIFDEDNPLTVIAGLRPDVLVKGGDWAEEEIVGADLVKESGGSVARIPFVTGYSTTDIIDKIRRQKAQ